MAGVYRESHHHRYPLLHTQGRGENKFSPLPCLYFVFDTSTKLHHHHRTTSLALSTKSHEETNEKAYQDQAVHLRSHYAPPIRSGQW